MTHDSVLMTLTMAEAMFNMYKKKGTSTYFKRTDCILLAVSVLIFGKFDSVSLAIEKKKIPRLLMNRM